MITESHIESLAIAKLEKLGYDYVYGPDILPDGETPERENYFDVLLKKRLQRAIKKINPEITDDLIHEITKTISRNFTTDLISNNEEFHKLLTEGVSVTKSVDG